jgi:hypothetical protein
VLCGPEADFLQNRRTRLINVGHACGHIVSEGLIDVGRRT